MGTTAPVLDRRKKKITPALIVSVTDRIVQHLSPLQVVLFGSQASGKATEESDLDLLVVLDDKHSFASLKRRDRFYQLLDLFRYRSFGLDAIVLTNAEIKALQDANEGEWDFVLEILAEGKMLYEGSQKT